MKRVILSGGGTGGHIYPAITIARELSKLDDVEFLFVGTPNGMESRIIPKEGFKFASIPAYGLKRSFTPKNLAILMKTAGSLFKARSILKHFHPDVVIGTGGYVCGPILMAAALSHIPTLIQEQNVIPGITNKILSHVVDTIALGYEEAKVRFPRPEKCVYTGNPIRPDIIEAKREESRRELGIAPDTFMVLITGGSRGARSINTAMEGVHRHFKDDDHLCLYHVTGTLEYDKIIEKVHADKEGRVGKAGRIIKYEYNMPRALAAADLIICRAGAVSLAELAARGLPAILIPYPYAAEDHQTFNARVFVAAGAAKMIVDKYLTDKELIQDITYLKETPSTLRTMSDASAGLGRIHAGRDIARLALELAEKGANEMNLNEYTNFHFIGIGGMGMRALAEILLEKGYSVSGSDMADSPMLADFRKRGASIYIGHDASHVKGEGCVVISSAISKDNPELLEAEKKGIPVFHRSDVLAALLVAGKGISVAGAHGKSTTSGMLGQIFYEARMDPTIVLGAAADYIHGNSICGKGDYVIAEADESDGSFLKFRNYITVVTNIEDDHLDHYGSVENIRKAFGEFVNHISYDDGAAFLCLDSEGVRAILPSIHKKVITFGLDEKADIRAVNPRYENRFLCYEAVTGGKVLGTVRLQVPGLHNVRDSLGALSASLYCGIPFEKAAEAISHFHGVKRRFETKFRNDDLWIVDDYAHHPTEIKATLKAARETGDHRIICAFQPHRYSRTKLLKDEFAEAFDDADILFFTDIYAASEEKIPGVDGHLIPDAVKARLPHKDIRYVEKVGDVADALYESIRPGDMVITMGAGSITGVSEKLIALLKEKGMPSDK